MDAQGIELGEVTSGTVSPSLGKPIMMAYIASSALGEKNSLTCGKLFAAVRDKRPEVKWVALPFVEKRYKR